MVDRIRVACIAMCKITDATNEQFLLALNRNRLLQGKKVFMPLGGALTYSDKNLHIRYQAIPEEVEKYEFRWFIYPENLNRFRSWFLKREDRETSPFRELREELVDEYRVLKDLTPQDINIQYISTIEVERQTDREGMQGVLTYYFHEIFGVEFLNLAHINTLRDLRTLPNQEMRWIETVEITNHKTNDDIEVDAEILLLRNR